MIRKKKDQKAIQEMRRPHFALTTKVYSISTDFLNMRKELSLSLKVISVCLFRTSFNISGLVTPCLI